MKQTLILNKREVSQAILNYGVEIGALLSGTYDLEITFTAGETIVRYEPHKQEKQSDDPTP